MSLPTVLVTGFEPFGGEQVNPSGQIALALHGETIAAHRVVGAILPTEFARSLPALEGLIAAHRPSLVLALGVAGGRAGISLERVAINLIDARIADNAGAQPIDVAVVENAPNAHFSTLPIKARAVLDLRLVLPPQQTQDNIVGNLNGVLDQRVRTCIRLVNP